MFVPVTWSAGINLIIEIHIFDMKLIWIDTDDWTYTRDVHYQ